MLRFVATALFALFVFISPSAAMEPVSPGQYTPVTDSSATALTIPSGATYAAVCAEGANHRYTWDGTTTPTASVGTQLLQNTCMYLQGYPVMLAFRIISVGGSFTVSYAKGRIDQ